LALRGGYLALEMFARHIPTYSARVPASLTKIVRGKRGEKNFAVGLTLLGRIPS